MFVLFKGVHSALVEELTLLCLRLQVLLLLNLNVLLGLIFPVHLLLLALDGLILLVVTLLNELVQIRNDFVHLIKLLLELHYNFTLLVLFFILNFVPRLLDGRDHLLSFNPRALHLDLLHLRLVVRFQRVLENQFVRHLLQLFLLYLIYLLFHFVSLLVQ